MKSGLGGGIPRPGRLTPCHQPASPCHAWAPGLHRWQRGLRAWAVETDRGSNPNSSLLLKMARKPPPKPKSLQGFPWTLSSAKRLSLPQDSSLSGHSSQGTAQVSPSSTKLAQTGGQGQGRPGQQLSGCPQVGPTMGICPSPKDKFLVLGMGPRSPGRGGQLRGWRGGLLLGSRWESVLRGMGRDWWVEG